VRILIVDDAPPLRTVLSQILISLGHDVAGYAADEASALTLAVEMHPDAIALDGRLKGVSVVALLANLRSTVPGASVLLVASLGETALVRAARDAGAAGVLARPFLRSRVAATLSEVEREREGRPPERDPQSPQRKP
jgi:DNA-binding response OmpR family regulator